MELRRTTRPSLKAFQQKSASKTSEITVESVVENALKYHVIDYSHEKLGRKMTPEEIGFFTTAIVRLANKQQKNNITEFNISGQEFGDTRVKKLMSVLVFYSGLHTLNLDQNMLTVKCRDEIEHLAHPDFEDLRLIRLDGNDFGTGEDRKIRELAGAMRTLVNKNKSLTINALHANFPGEIARELNEFRTENNDDTSSVQRIFVTDPSKPNHPTESHFFFARLFDNRNSAHGDHQKSVTDWEACCKVLSGALGEKNSVITILQKEGNRIFFCGPIPPDDDARRNLIDVLQDHTQSPGNNAELTLEFETEDGNVRMTREMASRPDTAAAFIQAAIILSD